MRILEERNYRPIPFMSIEEKNPKWNSSKLKSNYKKDRNPEGHGQCN